jgi:hypothetical protein
MNLHAQSAHGVAVHVVLERHLIPRAGALFPETYGVGHTDQPTAPRCLGGVLGRRAATRQLG